MINYKIINYMLYLMAFVIIYAFLEITGIDQIIIRLLWALMPFYVAILIAWLMLPVSEYLQRKRGWKKSLANGAAIGLNFLIIILVLVVVVPILLLQLYELIEILPMIISGLEDNLYSVLTNFIIDKQTLELIIFEFVNNITIEDVGSYISTAWGGFKILIDIGFGIIGFVVKVFITYIIAAYFIGDLKAATKKLINLFTPNKYEENKIIVKSISKNLFMYLRGVGIICSYIFLLYTIGCYIIGIPSPVLFGFIGGVLNIIPYLGPFLGGIPIFLVGLSISPQLAVLSVILITIVQFIESYYLQPRVMSSQVKLHPVTVIVGLIIFNQLFGILGMIIATPTLSVINILLKNSRWDIHL